MLAKKIGRSGLQPRPASKTNARARHLTRHLRQAQCDKRVTAPRHCADEASLCANFTAAMEAHWAQASRTSAATLIEAYRAYAERIALPDEAKGMVAELAAKLRAQGAL
jgi:hypothetical protein